MNNLLISIAVFIITVVGALFAVPYFVDWNSYRSNFEEEASRVVGREVQVDGDVKLYLLPTPFFRLEKVRIADTSPDLTFFKADSLSIKLSVGPILRGAIEANEIEFQRPILRLAINAKDEWNWQSFAQALGSAAYMPTNVTLTSLKITDGVLALHGPDGAERGRLEGLNGELSAPSLDGPYRFRGVFMSGGAEREIRLATAPPESDGAVRMRASMRQMDSGATYLLDARVLDLMRKPRIEGDLTARLPIAGFWQPQNSVPARKPAGAEEEHRLDKNDAAAFELKATVKADAEGAQLSDLALNFEQDGRPQIITGSMQANWRSEPAFGLALSSRWLDLDRVTAASGQFGPIESIAKFAVRLPSFLPGKGKAQATIRIEQANLGGESIGPVQLALTRSKNKLDIQELQIGLPGASRLELDGALSETDNDVAFDGNLRLRGTSVARFIGWTTANALAVDSGGDSPFGMRARLVVGGSKVAVRDMVGNLSATALTGSAHYKWGGRPEVAIALEGPQVDARAFIPAGASFADMFRFLVNGPDAKQAHAGAPPPPAPSWRSAQTDLSLRLNASQLTTASRIYRDVVAQLDVKGGALTQLQVRMAGEGFNLDLQGNVDDLATRPKGTVRGALVATAPAGIVPLAELFGVPAALRPPENRGSAMVPLRLAGSMTLGVRSQGSLDLVIDGEANGAAVKLNARFDGAPAGWRGGKAEVTATVDSAEGGKVVALLLGGIANPRAGPGQAFLKAVGVPAEGLSTIATLESGDAAFKFRGQIAPTDTSTKANGDLELRVVDGARLAALASLSPALKLEGVPVSGRLRLALDEGSIKLDRLALNVGGSRLAGQMTLAPAGDRQRIEATLDADEVSIAKLLVPLLDQRLAIAGMAEAAISGRQVWPDEPWSGTLLNPIEGAVSLTCKRLSLTEGVALENAKLDVVLTDGKIELEEVSGAGLGGHFKAKMQIAKAPGGAEVRGGIRFTAALDALGDPPRISGQVNGVLEFSGRGQSPRALMSTLQGQGKIQFGETKVEALSPGAVSLAADAGLRAEPDKLGPAVREGLLAGLAAGNLPIAQKTFALEIVDGQLRSKPLAVETAEGRASGMASLDLKALTFDSQWRLEAKPGQQGTVTKQLPPVTLHYRGPVAALGTIEPRIDSAALEQELSARKIERDVEELERLRRMDEARRLMEAERLRKQFEQPPPGPRPLPPSGVPIGPNNRETRPSPG